MRALLFVFAAPWPVVALMAVLAFGVGGFSYRDHQNREMLKAAALEQGAPPLIDLADLSPDAALPYRNEVHVAAYVDFSLNAGLTLTTKRKRSSTDDERIMYFLFDRKESKEGGQARAVVLVPAAQSDAFAAYVTDNVQGFVGEHPLFTLSGSASRDSVGSFDDLINQALAGAGLTRAPGFMVITPFYDGREAAFAPSPNGVRSDLEFWGGLGAILSLLTGYKFWRHRHRPPAAPSGPVRSFAFAAAPSPVVPRTSALLRADPTISRKKAAIFAVGAFAMAAFFGFGGGALVPHILVFGFLGLLYRKRIARFLDQIGFGAGEGSTSASSPSLARPKDPFDRLR